MMNAGGNELIPPATVLFYLGHIPETGTRVRSGIHPTDYESNLPVTYQEAETTHRIKNETGHGSIQQ